MKKPNMIAVMLDLGRQIERIDFLKGYADFIKESGYNTVVLYLEGSVRTSVTAFFDEKSSYSLAELKEIVDYMTGIGLDVIPAFETAFHMEKFFTYKELEKFAEFEDEHTQGRRLAPSYAKHGSAICPTNAEARAFTEQYVREVCQVFTSKYVHMGLDEIFEFAECEHCKKVLAQGKTKRELFKELVLSCHSLVKSMGREMMMWDDFFEYYDIYESLPRDIIFCNWNYFFSSYALRGKWTGRTKKDWFRIYDELGFRYVFCSKGTNVSSTFNIDCLTNYAEKFHPLGAMLTTWERSDCFYECLRPSIAYAAAKWNGKIASEEDRVQTYAAQISGDKETALLLTRLYAPDFTFAPYVYNITEAAEAAQHVVASYEIQLKTTLEQLEKKGVRIADGANTVAADIFDNIAEQYALLLLSSIGNEIFDDYEKGGVTDASKYEAKIAEAERLFALIAENGDALWEKDRAGIISYDDAWKKRSRGNIALVKDVREKIRAVQGKKRGVLYVDYNLPDTYGMVKGELRVKYKGDDKETVIYNGTTKTMLTMFDVSGCYAVRYAIEPREVEYVVFNAYGEGEQYPVHFAYLYGDKVRDGVAVEKLCGRAEDIENVLTFGVDFARTGIASGEEHLNDMSLSREKNEIKVYFKKL